LFTLVASRFIVASYTAVATSFSVDVAANFIATHWWPPGSMFTKRLHSNFQQVLCFTSSKTEVATSFIVCTNSHTEVVTRFTVFSNSRPVVGNMFIVLPTVMLRWPGSSYEQLLYSGQLPY
jgi:hypothetical protein